MSSFFKYPGQTPPVKTALVKAWVRPAKPAKRKKFSISLVLSPLPSFLSLLISKNTRHKELSSMRDKRRRVAEEVINDEQEARRVVEEERRERKRRHGREIPSHERDEGRKKKRVAREREQFGAIERDWSLDRERAIERGKRRAVEVEEGRKEWEREREGRVKKLMRDGKFLWREKEEEARREWREEDFPPLTSARDGSNFRREETRGERRGKSAGEMEEEFSSLWRKNFRRKREEKRARES